MRLGDLVAVLPGSVLAGDPDATITHVTHDSRQAGPGALFVAVRGLSADGNQYVPAALKKGASAVASEAEPQEGTPWLKVPDARAALALLSAAVLGRPADALTLVGVTGTNGKTTTTYIVEAMLRAAGLSPGVVGTVSYRGPGVPGGARPAPNTTPGALMLHELFAEMRAGGATDVVLEATSHALEQGRVAGCAFRVAVMINLTQDHFDYHGDMKRYADAKAILFEQLIDRVRGSQDAWAERERNTKPARRGAPSTGRVSG